MAQLVQKWFARGRYFNTEAEADAWEKQDRLETAVYQWARKLGLQGLYHANEIPGIIINYQDSLRDILNDKPVEPVDSTGWTGR